MSFEPDAGRLVDAVIPARWYGVPRTEIDVIVLHDMESPEGAETAATVSRWAQTLPATRKASWTYAVDTNSIVQCVPELVVAYAAPGANHNGIQIEHAGLARQSRAEWFDAYSRPMLELSARLSADICRRRDIPPVWLTPGELQAGKRGITSHANVSLAFRRSTHTDPGQGFPVDWYMARVRELLDPAAPRFSPPWAVFAGGRQIGAGRLTNPALIQRIARALKAAGHEPPFTARTGEGKTVATGRFWPPGGFTRDISRQLRAGRDVHIDGAVTIKTRRTP